jgi:predicted O-methyltransferase YrrM
MIVEYGPTCDRRLDRWYSSATRLVQRGVVSTSVGLHGLSSFARRRPVPESLGRRLTALGVDPARLDFSPLTIKPWKLEYLIELVENKPPRCVLELGSGVTTVVLAALADKHGFELLSLEHYPGAVRDLHRLTDGMACAQHIRVQRCGLARKRPVEGRRYYWFNADLEAYRGRFDFVLIDAPMARLTGRRGALPEIEPYLDADHRLVLDDSTRRHERACLAEWLRRFPALDVRYDEKVPDIAVMRLNKSAQSACSKAA